MISLPLHTASSHAVCFRGCVPSWKKSLYVLLGIILQHYCHAAFFSFMWPNHHTVTWLWDSACMQWQKVLQLMWVFETLSMLGATPHSTFASVASFGSEISPWPWSSSEDVQHFNRHIITVIVHGAQGTKLHRNDVAAWSVVAFVVLGG